MRPDLPTSEVLAGAGRTLVADIGCTVCGHIGEHEIVADGPAAMVLDCPPLGEGGCGQRFAVDLGSGAAT